MPWNYLWSFHNQWRQGVSYQPTWVLEPMWRLDPVWTDHQATAGLFPPLNIFANVIPTYRSLPSNPYTLGPIAYNPPLAPPAPALALSLGIQIGAPIFRIDRWDLFDEDVIVGVWLYWSVDYIAERVFYACHCCCSMRDIRFVYEVDSFSWCCSKLFLLCIFVCALDRLGNGKQSPICLS